MADYQNADGRINWAAYQAAQEAAGEICNSCGAYIFFAKDAGPVQCGACKSLHADSGGVSHDRFLRCPKCRRAWQPGCEAGIHEEGEHEVFCDGCEHEFTIQTRVSYRFESPELVQEGGDD